MLAYGTVSEEFEVGYPLARLPTWVVPEIGAPVLYAKGLAVAIF
jgi:hypothetical protein